MAHRRLTFEDRAEISAGLKVGLTLTQIAGGLGRSKSVISRELLRNNMSGVGGYGPVVADQLATDRRKRPQTREIDADPTLPARVRW